MVLVVVTAGPDIVVVDFVQPRTDEQKLVRDNVRVFVAIIAFEHEEIEDCVQKVSTECTHWTKAIAATTMRSIDLMVIVFCIAEVAERS